MARYTTKVLRDSFFSLPDARGNLPNVTYETSEHEGRRRNAERYETIAQMDQALDRRVRQVNGIPDPTDVQPGVNRGVQQGPPQGWSVIGSLLLIALGAGVAYVLLKKDDDEPVDLNVEPEPRQNPTQPHQQPVVTVVMPNQAPSVVVPPVVPPPLEENPRKRRRRARHAATEVVQTTTTVVDQPKT